MHLLKRETGDQSKPNYKKFKRLVVTKAVNLYSFNVNIRNVFVCVLLIGNRFVDTHSDVSAPQVAAPENSHAQLRQKLTVNALIDLKKRSITSMSDTDPYDEIDYDGTESSQPRPTKSGN